MRINLSQACAETLRGADSIVAMDPNNRGFYEIMYGPRRVVMGRAPGTGPYLNRDVLVEIDSRDEAQIRQVRDVARASGFILDDEDPRE